MSRITTQAVPYSSTAMNTVHENLRLAKRTLGTKGRRLTYAEIAAKLQARGFDIGPGAVGHYFTGRNKPDVDILRALAAILETNIATLAGEDPEYATTPKKKLGLKYLDEMDEQTLDVALSMLAILSAQPVSVIREEKPLVTKRKKSK